MRQKTRAILILAILCAFAFSAFAQQNETSTNEKIDWQVGPCASVLGDIAQIRVPQGYLFANASDTRILLEKMRNPSTGLEKGLIVPEDSNWYILFEFLDTGYIKDDEKDSFDANKMLESIKQGTEKSNRERAKRGWSPLEVVGWVQSPHYNSDTHNLEWCIKGLSDGHPVVNWNTRLLGRSGVMRLTLVADPIEIESIQGEYQNIIGSFSYLKGYSYAEYRKGDKIAKYGLSALVVGGATAVAAKTGLLKYLWKGLVVLVIGGFASLKKLIFGKNQLVK